MFTLSANGRAEKASVAMHVMYQLDWGYCGRYRHAQLVQRHVSLESRRFPLLSPSLLLSSPHPSVFEASSCTGLAQCD